MIRAVVVDDEKLVRKGFISLIDWERLGIVMVGEAADGRSALELLENVDADLLFTDITMPGLSGFELIKEVRHRFPRVKSVVLTCHHEFDFVQEALRLGAIDYIVKTLLEMDNADEVVNRIVERYEWEEGNRATFLSDVNQKRVLASSALLFLPLSEEMESTPLFQLGIVRRNPLEEINRIWLAQLVHPPTQEDLNRELSRELLANWQVAIVTGLDDAALEDVRVTIGGKLPLYLFYQEDDMEVPARVAYGELSRIFRKPTGEANNLGMGLRWTLYAGEWDNFVRAVDEERPEPAELIRLAEMLCRDWQGTLLTHRDAENLLSGFRRNRNWSDWRQWFKRYSEVIQLRMLDLSMSKEVMLCLIRAISYMKRNAGDKINQADVASYVNMSRSYFSQCFARLAGQSFGVVLRDLRLAKAKTLLLESSAPIYEIASMAGFEDDKYFSKLFRERVGKLPTEYRADCGKEAGV
ncbi:response regulator [Cohnella endophytica]|uniref:Response regulator n=1 Tax=Cohnella endophytica TaxID=2419778 RepID=A0A494YA07_9BACL|nr:response regulator [Cohnella endophytica]RKP57148.1 response regulator [Cohnella endophytica]